MNSDSFPVRVGPRKQARFFLKTTFLSDAIPPEKNPFYFYFFWVLFVDATILEILS